MKHLVPPSPRDCGWSRRPSVAAPRPGGPGAKGQEGQWDSCQWQDCWPARQPLTEPKAADTVPQIEVPRQATAQPALREGHPHSYPGCPWNSGCRPPLGPAHAVSGCELPARPVCLWGPDLSHQAPEGSPRPPGPLCPPPGSEEARTQPLRSGTPGRTDLRTPGVVSAPSSKARTSHRLLGEARGQRPRPRTRRRGRWVATVAHIPPLPQPLPLSREPGPWGALHPVFLHLRARRPAGSEGPTRLCLDPVPLSLMEGLQGAGRRGTSTMGLSPAWGSLGRNPGSGRVSRPPSLPLLSAGPGPREPSTAHRSGRQAQEAGGSQTLKATSFRGPRPSPSRQSLPRSPGGLSSLYPSRHP